MVEQQPTLLGTLFALLLPLLAVSLSGTLSWAAIYHLGVSLDLTATRSYGELTLYWLRATLLLGFAAQAALTGVVALRAWLRHL